MEPLESIRRLGFNRWYERQLIEGHAWFVSGFVCMITIAACVEVISLHGSALQFIGNAAAILGAGIVGIYGFVRYQQILVRAERIGEQATCGGCGTYARFTLTSGSLAQCRKCAHQWRFTV